MNLLLSQNFIIKPTLKGIKKRTLAPIGDAVLPISCQSIPKITLCTYIGLLVIIIFDIDTSIGYVLKCTIYRIAFSLEQGLTFNTPNTLIGCVRTIILIHAPQHQIAPALDLTVVGSCRAYALTHPIKIIVVKIIDS